MDLNSWLFLRVTGVFLVLAFVVHHLENFFFKTSFTAPLFAFVLNVGIVGFAVSHGLVGLKRVADDQGLPPRAQAVLTWTLVPVGLAGAYFATAAMLRFGLL